MSQDRGQRADSRGRLSTSEAAELAGQVAALAESGLPLESGLRALAEELPRGRLAETLRSMAVRLEAGDPLDEIIDAEGPHFPAHLRGLLLAGVRSGRTAEVMTGFLELHRAGRDLIRRVWLSLAYPILLTSMLSVMFFIADHVFTTSITSLYEEFDARVPPESQLLPVISGVLPWLFAGATAAVASVVFLCSTAAMARPYVSRAVQVVPLIGPLWRYSRLAQFARLTALLLERQMPLPEALRLSAVGVCDGDLGQGCRRVADEVESGRALSESLASHWQFPPTMIPLIEWGQRTSTLPEAFEAAAEVFEANVKSREGFLEATAAPITFLLVVGSILFLVVSAFIPLTKLIDTLSGH